MVIMGMNRGRWIAGVLGVLLAVGAGWWWLRPGSDERVLRGVLHDLARSGTRAENERTSTGLLKIRRAGQLFAPTSRLEFQIESCSGAYTPEELMSNLARFRQLMRWSELSIADLELTVTPPDAARAEFTGILRARTREGRRVEEVRNLVCDFRKFEGAWKIVNLRVEDVLQR